MTETTPSNHHDYERDARELALVDRIIGLEAQIAHLRSLNVSKALEAQHDEFTGSTTWKVGRLVLAPVMAAKRLGTRNGRR